MPKLFEILVMLESQQTKDKKNSRGVSMELDNLFAEFSKEVKADTYQSKIKAFKEFIIEEKTICDGTYATYFKAMSIDEILYSKKSYKKEICGKTLL